MILRNDGVHRRWRLVRAQSPGSHAVAAVFTVFIVVAVLAVPAHACFPLAPDWLGTSRIVPVIEAISRDPLSVRSPSVILGTLTTVLAVGFPAGSFAANCYLVAPAPGEECVIIDPGEDAARGIDVLTAEHRLKPVAVLLTHGHIDHVWSVAPVCGARDVPAYIHPADRDLLTDPARGFALGPAQQLFGGLKLAEPDDVRELADATTLHIAGLEITVGHAPGHTPGSVTFRVPGEITGSDRPRQEHDAGAGILFSGDLLFAGSIGRTDLPGGDYKTLMHSLARVCLPLPAQTVVSPGHGPQTTIGAERATNPFLAPLAREPGTARAGHRGSGLYGRRRL